MTLNSSMNKMAHFHPMSIEIARLQNSLKHLKQTQDELRPHIDDAELVQALQENEAVMSVCPYSVHSLTPNSL
jgi:ferredoxin-like protein FixX